MTKSVTLVVAVMSAALSLSAADRPSAAAPGAAGAASIQFAELSHDFGKLDGSGLAKHDFIFTNTGAAVLEITDVRPGCGCTTAGAWDKRVEPGRTGRIPLQFNPAGFSGKVVKSATITCNDPARTNVVLQIQGTIWKAIEVSPQSAYFSVTSETLTNETRVVRIVNNQETPLSLSPPECTNSAFRAELKTLKEGKEYELRVMLQPPLAANYAQASVTLKTSITNTPVLTIPAYVSVQPAVTVIPSQIVLPPGPLAAPVQPSVTIRNLGTNALALSDAAINLPGASLTLKELQPGRLFTLSVSLPSGLQLAATQAVAVTLKSNHPRFPTLRVPVAHQQRSVVAATPKPAPLRPPPLLARPVESPAVNPPAPR